MQTSTRKLVLCAVFMALIAVMTVIPYTGYINYGLIEITTLHLVVILGAVVLGWKYGTLLGFFWGVTCLMRAFTNPLWLLFTNPLISVTPRIFVGMAAGLVFERLARRNYGRTLTVAAAAMAATVTNTVLVLSAIYVFGGMFTGYQALYELFKTIIGTLITINGVIELSAALFLVPVLFNALDRAGLLPADVGSARTVS